MIAQNEAQRAAEGWSPVCFSSILVFGRPLNVVVEERNQHGPTDDHEASCPHELNDPDNHAKVIQQTVSEVFIVLQSMHTIWLGIHFSCRGDEDEANQPAC